MIRYAEGRVKKTVFDNDEIEMFLGSILVLSAFWLVDCFSNRSVKGIAVTVEYNHWHLLHLEYLFSCSEEVGPWTRSQHSFYVVTLQILVPELGSVVFAIKGISRRHIVAVDRLFGVLARRFFGTTGHPKC